MQLHSLAPRHKNYRSTVIGRGGKRGKTSGRGGKGQTARAGHKIRPEMRDIIKKIPKLRGWGRNRSRTVRPRVGYAPVNLVTLEVAFADGATITPSALLEKRLIRRAGGRAPKVKILGSEKISKQFTFKGVGFSKSAREALGLHG